METIYKTTVVTPTHTTFKTLIDGVDQGELTLTTAEFNVAVARMQQAVTPERRFRVDNLEAHVPGGPRLDLPPQQNTTAAPAAVTNNPPQGGQDPNTAQPKE